MPQPKAIANESETPQGFAFHYKMMNRDEDKLGEGQFATVRKAVQKKTGKIVAVKVVLYSYVFLHHAPSFISSHPLRSPAIMGC